MGFDEPDIEPSAFFEDLLGAQVVAAVSLGTVSVTGVESQCLVTGVDSGAGVVHLTTEREVPDGTRVYYDEEYSSSIV